MSGEKFLQLPGGALAFQEYGDPTGQPVVFCHGWPSSRTMAELTDEVARELGVRIISPDRPGISRSEIHRGRKLLDWPPVLRTLADQLGLKQFRMLAISGGAPYAYAAAWAMPERVPAIAVVAGVPPILELRDRAGLLPLYRWMLALYQKQPELLRACFHVVRPVACVRWPFRFRPLILKLLQPCDASSLRDSAAFEACFESQRRAWRGSVEGLMTDAQIYANPWGFALEEISVPVRLWHGTKDRSFSIEIAREVAGRLPHCNARFVEQAGHYSLPIRHMGKILRDLLAVKQGVAPALARTM
jgi:pimeloyl-ACP methyl ester carboxylesterase